MVLRRPTSESTCRTSASQSAPADITSTSGSASRSSASATTTSAMSSWSYDFRVRQGGEEPPRHGGRGPPRDGRSALGRRGRLRAVPHQRPATRHRLTRYCAVDRRAWLAREAHSRTAVSGAVAGVVWRAVEPRLQRVFGHPYSDPELATAFVTRGRLQPSSTTRYRPTGGARIRRGVHAPRRALDEAGGRRDARRERRAPRMLAADRPHPPRRARRHVAAPDRQPARGRRLAERAPLYAVLFAALLRSGE